MTRKDETDQSSAAPLPLRKRGGRTMQPETGSETCGLSTEWQSLLLV